MILTESYFIHAYINSNVVMSDDVGPYARSHPRLVVH